MHVFGLELAFIIVLSIFHCFQSKVIIKQLGPSVISTKHGKVRGALVEFPNTYNTQLKPVEVFNSLQYATLRNRHLRFMPPTSPIERWQGIRSTWSHTGACPQHTQGEKALEDSISDVTVTKNLRISQFTKTQLEDCLTINLYVPLREWNDTKLMPVMIFVHGESYEIGTGNAYDGSVLASYGGVIVVTVNYRLGVLGFLSTGDANARGNYALLDLLAILSWIKDNIMAFGGDKDRVTLFGHGHGAALVNIFLLSNMAKDETYFHRVILQSGSALSSWAISVNPAMCARRLAINVSCPGNIDTSEHLLKCLRSKSVEELGEHVPLAPKYYSCFAPSLNLQGFSSMSIRELMKDKKTRFAKTPVIFGVTQDEAYSYLKEEEVRVGISEDRKKQIYRTFVQNNFRYQRQKIFEILDHEYSTWDKIQDDITRRKDVIDLLSDGLYVAPLIDMANEHSKHNDTYLYVFSHSTASENYPKWVNGAHGDELPYIFGAPLVDGISPFPLEYSNAEKLMSENLMRFWTNFAKTGDPNLPEEDKTKMFTGRNNGVLWPKYSIQNQTYMKFGDDIGKGPSVRDYYRGREMALWLSLLPKINSPVDKRKKLDEDELDNASNFSSFDSSHRLINSFYASTPPIHSFKTPLSDKPDIMSSDETVKEQQLQDEVSIVPSNIEKSTTTPRLDLDMDSSIAHSGKDIMTTSSVPLSIIVAVGCSLLFLNILIFAGVYYQRERIRKQREDNCLEHGGNKGVQSKIEREACKNPDAQEIDCFLQLPKLHEDKQKIANTSNHKLAPTPLGFKTVAKAQSSNQVVCTYSPLSTTSSSPMHTNYPILNVSTLECQKPVTTQSGSDDRLSKSDHGKFMPKTTHVVLNNTITIV
ncbi:hypothetical protein CHS0354_035020 [Potamilus streckersoni]|uniref:Carboxylesterase type B domain-containing protein n=1 Tax=Potamilus streckersoni TaxID=2493646 RepID=A0AAE0SDS8_9BIVA|nr:hypothetical protein CHS0354_035020 [Potamilus streckersoni]